MVREYKEQHLSDFDVAIFETRSIKMVWFFSTDREREGLPPLDGDELSGVQPDLDA